MEYWLICKDFLQLKFFIQGEFCHKTIISRIQIHYSIIPEFQHSNWGEATKVFFSY
jgi:hypothetical protein